MTMVTVLVLMLLAAAGNPVTARQHSQANANSRVSAADHGRRAAQAAEQGISEDEAAERKRAAARKEEARARAKRRQKKEESTGSGRAERREHAPENREDTPVQPDTDDDSGVMVRLERPSMAAGR